MPDYLVVGEPVSLVRTGDWLKIAHLVELARLWVNANRGLCDWQEHAAIARAWQPPSHPMSWQRSVSRQKNAGATVHGWMAPRLPAASRLRDSHLRILNAPALDSDQLANPVACLPRFAKVRWVNTG
ncbi:hypothetical protein BN2476_960009 [Paraburkholderia piptadeniae]|uniref:Uncharacterized protein n=1 Tax=Paraburkholderia piptadeniae TaxID=1701573 RepID=A0A1N7SU69_9BURK|nr:hypothetical protein BN2476_960009 [Paraburkholderia piptadeniae]